LVGTLEVFKKELADHLGSIRLYILIILVYLVGISLSYSSIAGIKGELERTGGENVFLRLFTTQAGLVPSFMGFIAFLGSLVGIILVFDAINKEVSQDTLGMVVSQPIHRDSLIIGKFASASASAAFILFGIFGLMIGYGVASMGTFPTLEEALRIVTFFGVSWVYLSFWIGLGLFYSIVLESEGTSALASIATWIFFNLFIYMIAESIQRTGVSPQLILNLSPPFLYTQASSVILIPYLRILGPISYEKISGMIPNPLSFTQSLLLIWPHLTTLTAIMLIIFTISYVLFIKKEIRST
jgi:ABC-2 type transport system permease protein